MKTGYLRESDSKAWVRYPPPRWIWRGTAIAAVPHAVSAAMLHGWHGHNGQSRSATPTWASSAPA